MKEKKKGRVLLLISLIIGVIYGIYIVSYFGGAVSGSAGAEQVGAGIATTLATPHIVMTWIGVIFNALAFFMYNRPFALVAAILYTVAMVVFPLYFMFVIVEMILCYIAFAKMKKTEN